MGYDTIIFFPTAYKNNICCRLIAKEISLHSHTSISLGNSTLLKQTDKFLSHKCSDDHNGEMPVV